MQAYSDNRYPFAFFLFASPDAGAAEEIAAHLNDKGVHTYGGAYGKNAEKALKKAAAAVFLISPAAISDSDWNAALDRALRFNTPILPIYLSPSELPAGRRLELCSYQALDRGAFAAPEAFYEKLDTAAVMINMRRTKAQTASARRATMVSFLLLLLAAGAMGLLLRKTALQASLETLLHTGGGGSDALKQMFLGISKEDLLNIDALNLAGEHSLEQRICDAAYVDRNTDEIAVLSSEDEVNQLLWTDGDERYPAGEISDLSALSQLQNLTALSIVGNRVDNLSPLSKLSRLTSLSLCYNPVRDLSPLKRLKGLKEVNLSDTDVSDLSPLAGNASLKTLRARNCAGVESIREVAAHAPALSKIDLRNTHLKSLDGLSGHRLSALYIGGTDVTDLSELSGCTYSNSAYLPERMRLDIDDLDVSNYTPLSGIPSFYLLSCAGADPEALGKAIRGKEVSLLYWQRSVTDVNALAELNLQGLDILDLSESGALRSLDGIERMNPLNCLVLDGCSALADISALGRWTYSGAAFELRLNGCGEITDFYALSAIPRWNALFCDNAHGAEMLPYLAGKPMKSLGLAGSNIHEIAEIPQVQGLCSLHLPFSQQLRSIEGIERFSQLTEIKLEDCQMLTDLTPLLALASLERLLLSEDQRSLAERQLSDASFEILYQ